MDRRRGLMAMAAAAAQQGLVMTGVEMAWGVIPCESDITSNYTINHGLSGTPDFAILFADDPDVMQDTHSVLCKVSYGDNSNVLQSGTIRKSSTGAINFSSSGSALYMDLLESTIVIHSGTTYLQAGRNYYWLAYKRPVSEG